MRIRQAMYGAGLIVLAMAAVTVSAKEVTIKHRGITLDANLELAGGKTIADDTILITHGALAYRGMELIARLQHLLNQRGYNTLAINLSLGISDRHGMYDCKIPNRHLQGDAVGEIAAWVSWLQRHGTRRIVVLGHSRGGLQTALYASQERNPAVKAVVLMAPATRDNGYVGYQKRYGHSPAPLLERAEKLLKSGHGDELLHHIGFLSCRDTSASAASFVSYYGHDPRLDTPALIPSIRLPILVLVGSEDQVVVGLDKKLAPLVDGRRVQMKIIDPAGHMFRDLNADDAADAIEQFLKQKLP